MKKFSDIVKVNRDIVEGKFEMDVFAADLSLILNKTAPEEYQNPKLFFEKTYITLGLKNLLEIAEKRLKGYGGDSVIQLQTPFGGGKTHTLIALYHKAKDWNAKVVVFDGTAVDAKETNPWQELEKQLTGKVELTKGDTSPGKEKITKLLKENAPVLILIDELLEYATKAAGIKVGDSNLAAQTLAFLQELTGSVSAIGNAILFITLPSNILEHYDENAEKLFQQIQKITGRTEKIYTPVQDEEISHVIRKRLFSSINEEEARNTIEEFLDYAEREKILPEGVDKANYRERFIKSFPFQPEVIDILYKRWGSFPTFQRTRGVLRLLALVVYSLKDSSIPFIRLGDFDLNNDEIKRELTKHIGQEYDSIIAADITSFNAGAKKVDRSIGDAYTAFSFGTKSATAIFMYSFSGGPERGATINEIKLSCADPSTPSSIVVEAITKLKENLSYLSDTGLFFTSKPNLNRILLNKMETVEEKDIEAKEKELLTEFIRKGLFDVYIWPSNPRDIPDTPRLKLVIMRNNRYSEFLENCGERPRVYRNTLIFLTPLESERASFDNFLKKMIAWHLIEKEKTSLRITEEQEKEVKEKIKETKADAKENIRKLYRIVLLPSKDGFKQIDLKLATYGAYATIDKEIDDRLKNDNEILETLSPLVLKEKYLKDRDYVETKNILESFYKTPGEIRIIDDKVFKLSIIEGVEQGLFGIGNLENGNLICRYFKEKVSPEIVEIVEGEILLKPELCLYKEKVIPQNVATPAEDTLLYKPTEEKEEKVEIKRKRDEYGYINLKLNVPSGKLSDIARMVNFIKTKFTQVDVKVEITAKEGNMSISEYEEIIKEAIYQAGITVEYEKKE